jgi:hypothetical protein
MEKAEYLHRIMNPAGPLEGHRRKGSRCVRRVRKAEVDVLSDQRVGADIDMQALHDLDVIHREEQEGAGDLVSPLSYRAGHDALRRDFGFGGGEASVPRARPVGWYASSSSRSRYPQSAHGTVSSLMSHGFDSSSISSFPIDLSLCMECAIWDG